MAQIGTHTVSSNKLRIIPDHTAALLCGLAHLTPNDIILNPYCGQGQLLSSALQHGTKKVYGIESDPNLLSSAKSALDSYDFSQYILLQHDFLQWNEKVTDATVGIINPPFGLGSSQNTDLFELNYILHLCNLMPKGKNVIALLPQSAMTGKTQYEQEYKETLLEKHSLEGVITLNTAAFLNVHTAPCIALFTAHVPNSEEKASIFLDYTDDGYTYKRGRLLKSKTADAKKKSLLEAWNGSFLKDNHTIKKAVTSDDDWIYGYFHVNDETMQPESFEATVSEYILFYLNAALHGRNYMFASIPEQMKRKISRTKELTDREWKSFKITDLFNVTGTALLEESSVGNFPYLTAKTTNNGHQTYIDQYTEEGNVITFESSAAGHCFYQPYKFSAQHHVEKLNPHFKMNLYNALFIVTVLNVHNHSKFSYGYKASKKRIRQQKIYLPAAIDDSGPDFDFMEDYIFNFVSGKFALIGDACRNL